MNYRKQNSATYPFTFFMAQSSDHITGKTLATPAVQVSKNGGAFAAASGAVSELGGGWYSWAANATDRNTLGEMSVLISATDADTVPIKIVIVPWDAFDGNLSLTALPAAAAGADGGLPTVDANNGVKLSSGTGAGQIVLNSGLVRSDKVTGNVDGSVASITGVTFPANFGTLTIDNNLLDVNVTEIAGQTASQSGLVDANIVSVNGTVFAGANVPTEVADGSITAGKFAANAIDSTVVAANALDDIMIEGSYNLRQALSLIASALLGKISGAETLSLTFKALDSTTTRIVADVDGAGNRTSLTLTPPA